MARMAADKSCCVALTLASRFKASPFSARAEVQAASLCPILVPCGLSFGIVWRLPQFPPPEHAVLSYLTPTNATPLPSSFAGWERRNNHILRDNEFSKDKIKQCL